VSDPRLDDILRRLTALEDRAAIAQLIAGYGPSVDSGSAEETAALWTADGTYSFSIRPGDDRTETLEGADGIRAMVEGEGHQGIIRGGAAHFLGPPHIVVEGDRATAVTYSLLIVRDDEGDRFVVARAGANDWQLVRTAAGWRVERRRQRLLDGTEAARAILREAAGRPGV